MLWGMLRCNRHEDAQLKLYRGLVSPAWRSTPQPFGFKGYKVLSVISRPVRITPHLNNSFLPKIHDVVKLRCSQKIVRLP